MRHFLERIAAAVVVVVVVFVSFLLATVPPIKVTRTTPCDVFRVVLYFLGGAGLCFSACVLSFDLSVCLCVTSLCRVCFPFRLLIVLLCLSGGFGVRAYTRTPPPARRQLFRFRVAQGRW